MSVKNALFAIDGAANGVYIGRIMEDCGRGAVSFHDLGVAAMCLESACEADKSPSLSVKKRHFLDVGPENDSMRGHRAVRRRSFMKDMQESGPRGDLGTFLVCVQHRDNGSWQGRVTWLEQGRTVNFRSVWEMVQLIDEAIRGVAVPDVTWDRSVPENK